jgi:hypothetical protein
MTATRHREHTPPAVLAPFVDCIWTLRSQAPLDAPVRNRVLPDGCVDIIFDFGQHSARATTEPRLRSYLVGAMTRAVTVDQAGRVDMLAVRFRPGGASAFLRVPLGEVTDHAVDVDALGERWGAPASRIHAADSAEERMALLEQELLHRSGTRRMWTGRRRTRLSRQAGAECRAGCQTLRNMCESFRASPSQIISRASHC